MTYRILAVLILMWPLALKAGADAPQEPVPGNIVRYDTAGGGMLANIDVEWERYTRVLLERASVEFRENWVSDQRQVNGSFVRDADVEQIKADMSALLGQVLREALDRNETYAPADGSGADVLRFTPRIVKLDIQAPGEMQGFVGNVLIDAPGSMVLAMDVSDSDSGLLLASAWQLKVAPEDGFMDSVTKASNKTTFNQLMRQWAAWFFELLDYAQAGQAG